MDIYRLSEQDALKTLETSVGGLSAENARKRLTRYGVNRLPEPAGLSMSSKLIRQFTHFLAILLWIAASLAFLADFLKPREGMGTLGWAIVGVVVINAIFSFVQEYKAERAAQALRRLLPATAWVVRSGIVQQVSRQEVVPGDVLLLEEGEQISADARLIEAVQMRVDNASLTGESHARLRQTDPVMDASIDRLYAANLVFAGTTVLSGHGRAVVYATGAQMEFGKIAGLTMTAESGMSPLQQEIVRVTHVVAALSLAMGALFFIIGLFMGLGFWISAIFGIGIIVANVPEGLLPTVTLALAMGSQRMAHRQALIKQLTSVETLGCTTVICTDKTGTLTENRMRVERLYVDGTDLEVRNQCLIRSGRLFGMTDRGRLMPLFEAMIYCNNAKRVRRHGGHVAFGGDPTEVALMEFVHDQGAANRHRIPRMAELPFDADRKRMSTLHWKEGKLIALVKGAPESILSLCAHNLSDGKPVPLSETDRTAILSQSRTLAQQAYRILAVASRTIETGAAHHLTPETVERDLTFLGLVGLLDPPHREVPEAIRRCRRAGIRTIMITGDHPLTALAVARQIGLAPKESDHPSSPSMPSSRSIVIEGAQVDGLSGEELRRVLRPLPGGFSEPIFARMAPRHKMRIVSILKEMGEVVAVTGDGVNDAPALQKADIGIAMGIAGTDVAKETADMILLDDNFATIVNAIEEGRAVYANIRKFVTYVLSSNVPEIVPYLAYGLFGLPLALTIPQVLAVDLGTDMLPAVALGAEPPHPGIMEAAPRSRTERLLNRSLLLRSYAFLGLIEAAIAMAAFFGFLHAQGWTWSISLSWSDPLYREATTMTFAAIVLTQVANVFACRSERLSAFRFTLRSNPLILWGIAVELTLLALLVYAPFGHYILGTAPLPLWVWIPLALTAPLLLLAEKIRKMISRLMSNRRLRPGARSFA
jgi:sodium/potassium-transporting ATPase subunit alpha